MIFLHITSQNVDDLRVVQKHIQQGDNVFVIVHKTGCPPCMATMPKWLELENILAANKDDKLVHNIMQGRYQKYKDIITNDPSKAQYEKGWNNRLKNLEQNIANNARIYENN
mgnify:CR=1 FL=1